MVVRTASPDLITRAPASVPVASDSPVNVGTPAPGDQDAEQSLYLIGRPPLKQFLKFVRNYAVDPPGESALTDAWQAANAVVRQLEKQEAGVADDPPLGKLGPEYEPLLIEFLKDPLVHNGFNTVPTEVAIVELDRMVVYQEHIDVTHAGRVEQRDRSAHADEGSSCVGHRDSQVSGGSAVVTAAGRLSLAKAGIPNRSFSKYSLGVFRFSAATASFRGV